MEKRTRWPHHLFWPFAALTAQRKAADCIGSRRQRRWREEVVGWFLGVGGLALVLFGPGAVWLIRLELKQRQLDRQLAQLTAKREQLAAEEVRLRLDPAYVEWLIRTTFKYAKPDELVIPLDQP